MWVLAMLSHTIMKKRTKARKITFVNDMNCEMASLRFVFWFLMHHCGWPHLWLRLYWLRLLRVVPWLVGRGVCLRSVVIRSMIRGEEVTVITHTSFTKPLYSVHLIRKLTQPTA
jgi:hypothetical protein